MLIVWFLSIKSLPILLFGVLCLPGDQSHPVCATVNKPSCVLHLLGWFVGSHGFSSLERRPKFWVLHLGARPGSGKPLTQYQPQRGGKSGGHWNLCYLLSVCTLFWYPYGLSRNSWSGLTGPRASKFQLCRTLQGWLGCLETSRPSSCRTLSVSAPVWIVTFGLAPILCRAASGLHFMYLFRESLGVFVSPFLPTWDKD